MYGQIFEDSNYSSAKAGVNDCKFISFGLNSHGGAGGTDKNVIDLVVKVGGLEVKTRWFEVDPDNVKIKEVKNPLTSMKEPQTKEQAFADAVKEQQWATKSVLTALGVPTTAFTAAMAKVKDFKGYAQALSELVPKNATELNLECLLQFDSKGYLKMPDKLWVSGKFLRDKDSKQEPLECSARLKMHKDGEEAVDSTTSTSWSV